MITANSLRMVPNRRSLSGSSSGLGLGLGPGLRLGLWLELRTITWLLPMDMFVETSSAIFPYKVGLSSRSYWLLSIFCRKNMFSDWKEIF